MQQRNSDARPIMWKRKEACDITSDRSGRLPEHGEDIELVEPVFGEVSATFIDPRATDATLKSPDDTIEAVSDYTAGNDSNVRMGSYRGALLVTPISGILVPFYARNTDGRALSSAEVAARARAYYQDALTNAREHRLAFRPYQR